MQKLEINTPNTSEKEEEIAQIISQIKDVKKAKAAIEVISMVGNNKTEKFRTDLSTRHASLLKQLKQLV